MLKSKGKQLPTLMTCCLWYPTLLSPLEKHLDLVRELQSFVKLLIFAQHFTTLEKENYKLQALLLIKMIMTTHYETVKLFFLQMKTMRTITNNISA